MADHPIVVLKFGGRLVGTPARIHRAADYILQVRDRGESPVVVVSAPGRATDRLTRLAHRITPEPDRRELDMLLTVGERIGISLLAMAINDRDPGRAISFTGSQVGIITDSRHTDAQILDVRADRVNAALAEGRIPIVAGFQGVSIEREITSLGRGGSDATAIALAIKLKAARCDLIKEAGGIFTADPEVIPEAKLHTSIDYGTMKEMSSAGAQVIQMNAVVLAEKFGVRVSVRGLDGGTGTVMSPIGRVEGAIAAVLVEKNLKLRFLSKPNTMNGERVKYSYRHNGEGWEIRKTPSDGEGVAVDMVTVIGGEGGWFGLASEEFYRIIDFTDRRYTLLNADTRAVVIAPAGEGAELARRLHRGFAASGLLAKFIDVPN